jgi:hypothetical protein
MTRNRFRLHRSEGYTDAWLVLWRGKLSVSFTKDEDWYGGTHRVSVHTTRGTFHASAGFSS